MLSCGFVGVVVGIFVLVCWSISQFRRAVVCLVSEATMIDANLVSLHKIYALPEWGGHSKRFASPSRKWSEILQVEYYHT